ncbi:MAG TPA: beta-propeller fold lactonase family protein [Solirubrobacteraceae bacterium]|nr:beta-propeller fold lactonase family protein [Solirubrobacteraceae bacterium]
MSPALAAGKGKSSASLGFVFSQSNNPKANSVYVFKRKADGTIKLFETIKTGGKGTASQQPFGLPVVDSADSIVVSANGKLLFVVNDGSNTVTSFRIRSGGITRADTAKSGGVLPISLAVQGNLLYVLNGVSGSIQGYTFSTAGRLTPIAGSRRNLSVSGANGVAADIGFNPSGKWLLVTMRYLPLTTGTNGNPGLIDTFPVKANGSVGAPTQHTAATPTPFGFRFTKSGILVDTSAGVVKTINNAPPPLTDGTQANGSLQTYTVAANGTLTPISNAASGGRAACWVVLTNNDKYAFVTNTLSATATNPAPGAPIGTGASGLARYKVAANGSLTFLGNVNTGPGTPTDVGLSPDGKYLYMANPTQGLLPFGSHVEAYKVGPGGSLTLVGATPMTLAPGLSGIAVS